MFKVSISTISGRIMRAAFWTFVAALTTFVVMPRANALACGDKITADVTLTADLGPCPNIGIFMDGIPAHVTIDLNGHTIRGKGTGAGISMGAAFAGVTVKGPGKIINFLTGVSAGSGAPDLMVYNVTFSNDGTAVGLGGEMGTNIRIFNNKMQGGAKGTVGVLGVKGSVYIYQNQITGFSLAGVSILGESGVAVDNNYIAHNGVGVASIIPLSCTVIRGNTVTLNRENGIQFGAVPIPQTQPTVAVVSTSRCGLIEDNKVTSNGGDGIFVPTGEYGPIVQDNIVSSNSGNGIEINGSEPGGGITIEGNQVSGNTGSDFFWDGNGSVCWDHNVYGTSSPASLPECSQ